MKKLLGVMLILLFFGSTLYVKTASATYPLKVDWAVIIVGTDCLFDLITQGRQDHTCEPLRTAFYLFHVLREHFGVPRNHIRFLDVWLDDDGFEVPYGTIDAEATKAEIKYTLNTWLQSTPNDNVLLFIFAHGSGYLSEANSISSSATREIGGDEGDEILESTYGQDVNGNGDKNDWFGVDESLVLVARVSVSNV